jgi:hypothetical protein
VSGHSPERYPGYLAWEPLTFEVDSGDLVDAGTDGEALRMSPPLRFAARSGVLRIRVPQDATGQSPGRRISGIRADSAAPGRPGGGVESLQG